MKNFLIILLLVMCYQFYRADNVWAEISNYSLNQIEIADGTGKSKLIPSLDMSNKPISHMLTIAGLGTNRVTAQCPILSLSIETQIFPLVENNGTGTDGADWYYVTFSQGVTVIQLKGDNVKVYNLGMVPYTYVGTKARMVSP